MRLDGLFHCNRTLRLMRVIWTDEYFQLGKHFSAKSIFWKHSANGFTKDFFRSPLQSGASSFGTQARVSCVPRVAFLVPLVPGEFNFFGVHNDDKIASVDVRRVGRAMLAHQDYSNSTRQTTDNFVGSIDDKPLFFNRIGFCLKRFRARHRSTPVYRTKNVLEGSSIKLTIAAKDQAAIAVFRDFFEGVIYRFVG